MGTNKNAVDQPGVVKKIRTAVGTITQSVPIAVKRPARTASKTR